MEHFLQWLEHIQSKWTAIREKCLAGVELLSGTIHNVQLRKLWWLIRVVRQQWTHEMVHCATDPKLLHTIG